MLRQVFLFKRGGGGGGMTVEVLDFDGAGLSSADIVDFQAREKQGVCLVIPNIQISCFCS